MKNNKILENLNNYYVDSKAKNGVYTVKTSLNSYYPTKSLPLNYREPSNTKQDSFDKHPKLRKILKNVEYYLKNSTLHGLTYVGDTTISYGERFFWLVAFTIAVISALYFISNIYVKFSINPVIVSMNPTPTPVEEIPFPAVTICNMNAARKTIAEKILLNGTQAEKSLLADMCDFNIEWTSSGAVENNTVNWEKTLTFMTSVSQSCHKMLKVCKWRLKDVDCKQVFQPIATDEGLCCTFNMLPLEYILRDPGHLFEFESTPENHETHQIDEWNPERGYAANASYDVFPFRSPGPGAHLGLTLVLDADVDDYFCSTSSSTGIKTLLHNPAEIPKMSDFAFMLPPGCEIRVVFKPTINDATETLRSIDVKKRRCYFTDERYLKFYKTYTKVNCKMECLANITLQRCGCVPYYLPRGTSTKICGKMQEACSDNVREMMDLKEMPTAEEQPKIQVLVSTTVGHFQSNNAFIWGCLQAARNLRHYFCRARKRCDCLSACFQLDFEKSMSYGRLTDTFKIRKDIIKNQTADYFKKNMLVVQIYFVNTQFSKFTKSELYGFSEFLSNTGGILGLFLGFSILSVVEIFYHLILRSLCISFRNRNNKTQGHKLLLVNRVNY